MGRHRESKVEIKWSDDFAYSVGLITTDGNLSPDGRHISFSTKDFDLVNTYRDCLKIDNKIGVKARGGSSVKDCFVVQFGDKNFYEFLLSVGLEPAKSKSLRKVKIPKDFFAGFLRGCIDGDGSITVTKHPGSRHLQLRVRLCAYNQLFLEWVKKELSIRVTVNGGWIYSSPKDNLHSLTYARADSIKILRYLYGRLNDRPRLERKYKVARLFL